MADKTVFDMDLLLQATCDDMELAGQVVGVFLSDIPVQLAGLEKALSDGDARTAERVAHSIKGAAATVGGETFRALGLECEQAGREGRLNDLSLKFPELKSQYQVLKEALLDAGFTAE